jgi:hypothetical protein
MSPELETAIASASRATLEFHGLMAIHGIVYQELYLLLEWPAGLREAHAAWTARMVDVVKALAREDGIPDTTKISERDRVALTVRAYDLVMS